MKLKKTVLGLALGVLSSFALAGVVNVTFDGAAGSLGHDEVFGADPYIVTVSAFYDSSLDSLGWLDAYVQRRFAQNATTGVVTDPGSLGVNRPAGVANDIE